MFDTLNKGFRNAKNRLTGLTELTEQNIDQALRDVRLSLLEADVDFHITKQFLANVKEKAVGTVVQKTAVLKGQKVKIGPAEKFIKICQDELEQLMKFEGEPITFEKAPNPTILMMVGLQGAGKTTTSAKMARLLRHDFKRKPLLVAADVQRPGAIEQLQTLGAQLSIPVFSIPGGNPVDICTQALGFARQEKCDTIILDTAGRLAIDEPLMQELSEIKTKVIPKHTFLVIDAMIGQDAVRTAKSFHEKLSLDGVVLTKLDGDARGGSALSIREATGVSVKFAGMGETMDKLEVFRADGMASRILGFGDVVGLMKDFESVVDEEKAEKDAMRMLKGQFTLDDFLEQISMIQQMGPLQDMLEKLPFFADSVPDGFTADDRELVRIRSMIQSMTRQERRRPELLQKQATRIQRVARGSGRKEKEVSDLLQRFNMMKQMMGGIGKQAGLMSKIPGMKQLAMAKKLKDSVNFGGMEGNPMLSSMAGDLFEAAVAGSGAQTSQKPPPSKGNRQKKKKKRKDQKKSRKKSRK